MAQNEMKAMRGPPQSVRFSAGLARTSWHATDVYAAALAMTSEPCEGDFSDATSIQEFCARATLRATIRCLCRTKELQLTDCQAQHCRAKREPLTDFRTLVDRTRHHLGPLASGAGATLLAGRASRSFAASAKVDCPIRRLCESRIDWRRALEFDAPRCWGCSTNAAKACISCSG